MQARYAALTERQREVLLAIKTLCASGKSPTYDEIGARPCSRWPWRPPSISSPASEVRDQTISATNLCIPR
jgi:hypothetical protein